MYDVYNGKICLNCGMTTEELVAIRRESRRRTCCEERKMVTLKEYEEAAIPDGWMADGSWKP